MATNKRTHACFCISILFLFISQFTTAQERSYPQTIFELLTKEEGGKFTLQTDLISITENRRKDEYTPAILTAPNGKSYTVNILPKGKFRRQKAEVPPLKIKFPKKTLRADGLDTLNELKLILPCFDSRDGDELLAKEYLIYKMFEHLTSNCVKARLIQVELRDSHVEKTRKSMLGILVEDNEETAARLNGVEVEQYGMPVDSLQLNQVALVAMFQYMIGNTDWDIAMLRNVRLIRPRQGEGVLVMPYDFDFSGLVGAPYASPASESGLESVLDRFLMANGIPRADLRRAAQTLTSAKDDLYNICHSKYLARSTSNDLKKYLDTFFDSIDKNFDVPVRKSFEWTR